jgi:hypothetical protein
VDPNIQQKREELKAMIQIKVEPNDDKTIVAAKTRMEDLEEQVDQLPSSQLLYGHARGF